MHYQISRNGQLYGPYTLEDLQRYLASGNILPTDLAKSAEMSDWLPVSQIVAGPAAAAAPIAPEPVAPVFSTPSYGASAESQTPYVPAQPMAVTTPYAAASYAEPPNLHWALVMLISILTCGLFMFVWNLVVAAWLKRVQPNATSLFFYLGAAGLLVVQIIVSFTGSVHTISHPGLHTSFNPIGSLIGLSVWVVRLIARYSQRASLEEHYNGPEPVGLRLSPIMTFFFGGLYFQYHLNRISEIKIAARYNAIRNV